MGMIGNTPYNGIVQTGNIQDGAITAAKHADASVTAAKLAATAVTDKLGFNPLDASKQKRGIDMTGRASPTKHQHDWLWYQFAGTITPAQVPVYCADIDAAEKLAAWYVQRLFTEFKNTENDSMYDGLHYRLPAVSANTLSKLVAGASAPSNAGVDYDNPTGDGTTSFQQYPEWLELVVGSNGSTELYTMAFAVGMNSSTPTYPTRLIYQKTRNAADWRTDFPSWTLSNADSEANVYNSAPKCTTRTTSFTTNVTVGGILMYPVTLELNF